MRFTKSILFLGALTALVSCSSATSQATSYSIDPEYKVKWVTPTGIPTIAFYDQGSNANWVSYSAATEVAKGFATDNVDCLVFDGYSGLTNIKNNNRNYVLARWISGGTFYLVSTKHSQLGEYQAGQSIQAFVKTGNASQAFLNLAKTHWNWGDLSGEGSLVKWEEGVATVKNTIENNDQAYDWYVVAQPVLFALTNTLKAQGKTLNVVADLQSEWAAAHNGAKIPAAALFVNKTKYAEHPGNIHAFIADMETRIAAAINEPSKVVTALSEYAAGGNDVAARFGFQAPVVNALQKDGANAFGLIAPGSVSNPAEIANAFARDLGTGVTFDDALFLK